MDAIAIAVDGGCAGRPILKLQSFESKNKSSDHIFVLYHNLVYSKTRPANPHQITTGTIEIFVNKLVRNSTLSIVISLWPSPNLSATGYSLLVQRSLRFNVTVLYVCIS